MGDNGYAGAGEPRVTYGPSPLPATEVTHEVTRQLRRGELAIKIGVRVHGGHPKLMESLRLLATDPKEKVAMDPVWTHFGRIHAGSCDRT